MSEIARYATEEYVNKKDITDEEFENILTNRGFPIVYEFTFTSSNDSSSLMCFDTITNMPSFYLQKIGIKKNQQLNIEISGDNSIKVNKVEVGKIDITSEENVVTYKSQGNTNDTAIINIENVSGDVLIDVNVLNNSHE